MKKLLLLISLLLATNAWADTKFCADHLYKTYITYGNGSEGSCKLVRYIELSDYESFKITTIYIRNIQNMNAVSLKSLGFNEEKKIELEEEYQCPNVVFKEAFSSTGFPKQQAIADSVRAGLLGRHADFCALTFNGKDHFVRR